jgi:hypothetical protein
VKTKFFEIMSFRTLLQNRAVWAVGKAYLKETAKLRKAKSLRRNLA